MLGILSLGIHRPSPTMNRGIAGALRRNPSQPHFSHGTMEIKEKKGWWLGQRALELEPFTEFGGGSDYVTHGNTFGDHNVEASNIVPIVMLKPFVPSNQRKP